MRHLKIMLLLVCTVLMTACSDDEPDKGKYYPPIEKVFPMGLPKSVTDNAGYWDFNLLGNGNQSIINVGQKGYPESITFSSDEIDGKSRGVEYYYSQKKNLDILFDAWMKVDQGTPGTSYYYFRKGTNGFIRSAYGYFNMFVLWQYEYITAKYNANNQITNLFIGKYENNFPYLQLDIQYTDNNPTFIDRYGATHDTIKIEYTNDEFPNGIPNTTGIVAFNFETELRTGPLKYAFWGGFLGKSSELLPLKMTISSEEGYHTFSYDFNDRMQPTTIYCTNHSPKGDVTNTITYTW